MCRTGTIYSKCDCGADISCTFEFMCRTCFDHWMDVDDSELEI